MAKAHLLTLPLILAAHAAWAVPATDDGAKALTAVFQTYLGKTAGLVTVVPSGEAYQVTLDVAPLIALIPEPNLKASVSPLVLSVAEQGGGLWGVTIDQPVSIDVSMPDALDFHATMARLTSEGTFDEALGSFAKATGHIDGLVVDEKMSAQASGAENVHYEMPSADYVSTEVAGATGGVDMTANIKVPSLTESFDIPVDQGGTPMPVSVAVQDYNFDWNAKGYMAKPILGLIAYAQAHMADARFDAAPAKAALTAALPLFQSVSASGSTGTVAVTTPFGVFAVTGATATAELHGIIAEGLWHEALALKGISIPAGLVPDWAAPLVPADVSLDLGVSGYDLAAAAPLVIGLLDLVPDGQPASDFEDKLLAALMPKGTVTISLAPGTTGNAAWRLNYEGAMQVGPQTEIPTGTASFSLTGADALIAALNAAPDDLKNQVVPAFMLVRGMAKAGNGKALVWDLDATTPGSLLVNGTDVMKTFQ